MPNPRAQKPLTLAQVKKDLLSFKEPLTALADTSAGALRGLTLGTFGIPGEIESLGRSAVNAMLQSPSPRAISSRGQDAPQISDKTFLPTMDELSKRWSPTIPEGVPDQKSRERSADFGETFGRLGVLPGTTGLYGGLYRGAKSLPAAVKHGALEFAKASGKPSTNIVKSGGGNWLRQGLDEQRYLGDAGNGRAMQGWNRQPPENQARYPERQMGAVAEDTVADWANKNMLKYMANQMGTKDDPVRKLAEQNISHFGMRPDEFGEFPYIKPSDETRKLRKAHTERTGEESPVANSSLAAYWENLSDNAIKATTVGDIKNAPNAYYSHKAKEDIAPFADKVPPETPIYNIDTGDNYQTARQSLGFNRMMDVMREDIAAGRVSPEDVAKWDMEQAVRHVDKRDKAIWKAEADEADRLAKEFARYFPTLKEYPDKSRWIELKVPDLNALPKEERLQLIDKLRKEAIEKDIDPEQYIEDYPRMKLEEALAHEGEKMGHCVGTYCEDVITGKSRVISYRDANGDSHVTLEVTPPEAGRYPINEQEFQALPPTQQTEYSHAVRQWRQRNPDVQELEDRHINQALEQAGFQPRPDEIKQIKGKQDAAPVGRYQPYVQDFQRMTKYPIEGDFANSGFDFPATGPRGIFDEDQVKTLREAGHDVPDYLTKAERENLVRKLYERETGNDMDTGNPLNPPEPPTEGMKAGGAVHISDNPDTMAMELQNQHYQAGGVVRGLKALKGALRNPEALVPSARGATKFAEPAPKTMSIMKEKGGNWLGGNIAGGVDKRLKLLKTQDRQVSPLFLEDWRQDLKNPSTRGLSDEDVATTQRRLNEHDAENAVNQWIERNVGNYVKKEMGTPEDPVRLMLEKRAQEIEAQFQVDMNRAERTRARAEAEDDLRRKVNLTRQAQREEEQAKFDRDFAMEHATHLPKNEVGELSQPSEELMQKRLQEGYQMLGEAKSDPAQRWENLTDEAIDITRAGDIQKQQELSVKAQQAEEAYRQIGEEIENKYPIALKKFVDERGANITDEELNNIVKSTRMDDKASFIGLTDEWKKLQSEYLQGSRQFKAGLLEVGEENPFVSKLDPETNLYSSYLGDLGIDHVIDVIKQDVTAGRIRPEQLNKLTMDQAIKRTAEFNMEQAKKMRETAIKNMEGFPTHKDYGDEGYKWIELKMPEATLPEGYKILPDQTNYKNPDNELFTMFDDQGNAVSTGATEAEALRLYKRQEREQQLAEALKYEGDTMGHCVGGYCPDVIEGKSRIYSLRDKRGEPHVTVEVQPTRMKAMSPQEFYNNKDVPPSLLEKINQAEKNGDLNDIGSVDLLVQYSPEYNAYLESVPVTQSIRQIKGKGNARPIEKYDPYTQDFVRSGEWSGVGDLKNTGLIKHEGKYMTQAEYDDYLLNELRPPPAEGMKAGGKVHVSDNCDCMRMELDNKKFAMGGAVMNPNDIGSPSPQNSASPVPSFQAGGAVKGLAAVKQALTGGKKAATAVKPSLVIKSEPSLIVSNLIDEEPNIAKRLGAEARAKRQKAIEAEGKRQEAAKQTQPSVGYRPSTPQKPDPLVGTRFVNEPAFGLNPNDPFDIAKYKGGSGMVLPWDSQSRNVKTTQVSDVDLPNQVFDVTHGGIPYAFDTQHVAKGIAGASGKDISMRIKTRADTAVRENKDRGGTGELLHFPITMGYRAEDYALPYSEFSFDIINYKLMTGELTKREADELTEMVRNFSPPKYKGKKPFAEFAGFTEPEGLNQIYTGEGLKVPSGELRKAIADRIIWQKGSQEKLGFNAEDLMNATTYEPLRGVDKGFIGSTVMRNTPTGMRLSPSAGKYPYDTDFSGEHLGRLDDLVDVEALFHRTLNPIKHELITRENLKPYNKESLRNAAIGAIEKRNEGISQPIDQQFLDDYNDYINELKKPHEYRVGGAIRAKRSYQAGGAVKGLKAFADAVRVAKTAKPAVKGMQEVLPAVEREANLKNFLKPSKVKQPVYHGTMSDVKEFKTPAYFGNKDVANQFADPEYLTGSDTLFAGEHPNVMPVHLGFRKPKVFKTESDYEKHVMEGGLDVDKWKKKGYDSVIYAPEGNLTHEDAYFVAFEPQQVKSALGNRGTYDIKEAEINKRRGGAIHARRK